MTQLWLIWWPKNTSATKTTSAVSSTAGTCSEKDDSAHCCCLTKLVKKLKERSKMLRTARRRSSFQCRYDPLSYSLNFDTSGCGSFVDEDYYQFYAFSSRFVANPKSLSVKTAAAAQ